MFFLLMNQRRSPYDVLPLSDFRQLLQEQAVVKVTIEGDSLYGQLLPSNRTGVVNFKTELPQGTSSSWQFTQWLLDNRGSAVIEVRNNTNLLIQVLLPLVPWVLIFGFIWFFVFRKLKRGEMRYEPMRGIVTEHEQTPPQSGIR